MVNLSSRPKFTIADLERPRNRNGRFVPMVRRGAVSPLCRARPRRPSASVYFEDEPGRAIGRQAADLKRGAADRSQRGEAAGVATPALTW
jgi:hypothetical protein